MSASLRYLTLILCVWLMTAGVCFGKQVHLKDGGIIECESVWRRGGIVTVKINRDTVIDLERSEVDLKRTFPDLRKKSRQLSRKKPAHSVVSSIAGARAAEAATTPVTAPGQATAANPVGPATPATAPAGNKPATPAAKQAPPAATSASAAKPPQPAAAQPASSGPSLPPDKAELERRSREAAVLMVEALRKNDPELLKKAVLAQQSAIPQKEPLAPGMFLKYLLLLLACFLLIVVSLWVIFKKAGQSGFASIIPFYNGYILMVVSGKPGWWLFLMFIPIVGFVCYLMALLALAQKFGKGALFGVGLLLLPMFFFPMLAFGGAQYEG